MEKRPLTDIETAEIATEFGHIAVRASGQGVVSIDLSRRKKASSKGTPKNPHLKLAVEQLREYLEGQRQDFTLRLAPEGTPFQKKVWDSLLGIPYGKTKSYSEIAKEIRQPKASRAVGMANGRNPIPIVIPCHRVIGKNGDLTGFSCGIDIKKFLLRKEGILP